MSQTVRQSARKNYYYVGDLFCFSQHTHTQNSTNDAMILGLTHKCSVRPTGPRGPINALSNVIVQFYRATACNATHGYIAVAILYVCLSVRCVYCDKTKQRTANILIPHETAITSFLTPTVVGGRCPLPSEICAQSDPPPSKNADFDRFPLITSQP